MKSTAVWALAALNVVLLVMLATRGTRENAAVAQNSTGRPGDYLMIPGEVIGGTDAVVYILDQSSHQLSAMAYDDSGRRLATMPPMNLDRVFGELSPQPAGNRPRR
jgi:hypothetical protein